MNLEALNNNHGNKLPTRRKELTQKSLISNLRNSFKQ